MQQIVFNAFEVRLCKNCTTNFFYAGKLSVKELYKLLFMSNTVLRLYLDGLFILIVDACSVQQVNDVLMDDAW